MSGWWEEYKGLVPVALGALGLGLLFLARNLELNRKRDSRYLVKSLVVYPIKSCGAVNLQTAIIGPHGFLLDRHWVVVREDEASFITQRELPQMALIQISFEYGPGERRADNDNVVALVLNAPGKEPLRIPIGNSEDEDERPQRTISVWKVPLSGKDEGDAAAEWLSDYLGRRVRLYGMAADYERNMGWENAEKFIAPTKFEQEGSLSQDQVRSGIVLDASFVDDHPFLLLSTDSVEDVNNHLRAQGKSPIGPDRFRANIIVEPAALPLIKYRRTAANRSCTYPGYSTQPRGFIEDSWGHITFVPASGAKTTKKSVDLISVGKKTRCRLTTVVPDIGEYPPRLLADGSENPDFNEPLAMLRKYRTFEKYGPSPACGQTFAFHRTSIGNIVTVGSEVLPFTFVDEDVASDPAE